LNRQRRELLPGFVKRGLTQSTSEAGEEVLFAVTAFGFGLRGACQRLERRRRESELVGELGRKGKRGVEMDVLAVVLDVMGVAGKEVRRKPEGSVGHGSCGKGCEVIVSVGDLIM